MTYTIDKKQKEVLTTLIAKPQVWLGSNPNKENITISIHGMESMMSGEFFSVGIDSMLYDVYEISGGSFGWPHAVEKFAKRNSITWWDAFVQCCKTLNI